ncbi:hypothetical protein [Actinokineospora fastidiosa]|uniref:Uncharacterized protein n=1 Tax=Actinokineospora fastidiosa TaxID=1816 RepID=A0A918GTL7_9PSEU|nr:hypothetical protein [Actinokineospora fastidiosa]GGS61392.1 hypothetical protein GCM10010171_65250 [Actinokineospora fastidiosa]
MSGIQVHRGKVSWWDGSVTTLCGIKWSKQEAKARRVTTWFSKLTCPACIAALKGGKR